MAYVIFVVLLAVLYLEPNGMLNWFRGLRPEMQQVAQILGLAVFLILTFRNNAAYLRWYEGAQRFHDLCGLAGNVARYIAAVTTPSDKAVDLLWWLVAALYSAKQELRSSTAAEDFALLKSVLPPGHYNELELRKDKFRWAVFRYTATAARIDLSGKTEGKAAEEVMRAIDPMVNAFTQCWRILQTPMPFAYISHLRSFLILWLILMPWIFVASYLYW